MTRFLEAPNYAPRTIISYANGVMNLLFLLTLSFQLENLQLGKRELLELEKQEAIGKPLQNPSFLFFGLPCSEVRALP